MPRANLDWRHRSQKRGRVAITHLPEHGRGEAFDLQQPCEFPPRFEGILAFLRRDIMAPMLAARRRGTSSPIVNPTARWRS
jgi:hypothetical protein